MADQNERPEVTVGRIDLGQTEPRQPTQDEQRIMDGALRCLPRNPERERVALEGIILWSELALANNRLALANNRPEYLRMVVEEIGKIAREGLG